jgi:hypothetical protein
MTDDVTSSGVDALYSRLDQMKAITPQMTGEILLEAAETFLTDLRSFLTYGRGIKTGEYIGSWAIQQVSNRSVTIGTPKTLLFECLEYGTRPHPIEGNPLLHFQIGGQDVFVTYVNHPGTPPIPHLRPTIELLKIKLPMIVQRVVAQYFSKV